MNIVDLSNWKSSNLKNFPADGYIFKLTEGTNFFDKNALTYIKQAREMKKPFGLYHFMDGKKWENQVDYFVKNVKPYIGEAVLFLDYEAYGMQGADIAEKWLDSVTQKTGVKPLIYMSASVTKNDNWASVAKKYGLWVADYTPPLDKLGYWTGATLWQYTENPYDKNYFYGTKTDWEKLAKGKTTPPKPSKLPSLEQLATDTQKGKYGNGEMRKKNLQYLYRGVQAIINHRADPDRLTDTTVKILTEETLKGYYGNGEDRKARLGNYYTLVQNRINKM